MKADKIKVLFFAMNDDKFYNPVFNSFALSDRYVCEGLLYLKPEEECFIKTPKSLTIIRNIKDLKLFLGNADYDVVYFFSMDVLWWKIIDFIPVGKTIIWWTWGYDIYEHQSRGVRALLHLPIYKVLTNEYVNRTRSGIVNSIRALVANLTTRYYYERIRFRNMRRIDFIQPVISEEYRMLKETYSVNAMEYYCPEPRAFYESVDIVNKGEDIQIGNSSSYTNNHLDVWQAIKDYIPKGRTVVIPLSYGDKDYAGYLKGKIQSEDISLTILDTFMPFEEYSKIISHCSYAVYGVIRQQAVGNIRIALKSGIKLFFYRDSIVYKHFINKGYCVFAIEDINENSFVTPLTSEQKEINAQASLREYYERKSIHDKATADILSKIQKEQ